MTIYSNIDIFWGDSRIISLELVINGLEESINNLLQKEKELDWYDGLWFLEESEPILGLAFIAFQNYINSSIFDKEQELNNQFEKYKIQGVFFNTNRSKIELIIALANYYKHRDSPKSLFGETVNILKDFNLKFDKDIDIVESPIFKGFDILSKNNNLEDVISIVINWRKELWKEEYPNNYN